MRTSTNQAWIILVVTLAFAGGLASFLLATPDQSRRVQPDQLGFQQLDHARLEAALGGAAEYHRVRVREARAVRAATGVATGWLRAVPGSRGHVPTLGPTTDRGRAATGRVRAFTAWADDLPASAWSVRGGTGTTGSDATVVDVHATVDVTIAQAMQRVRHQRVAVTLELTGAGARWHLADLHADGPETFVRAYADPTIVHRGVIDVVGDRARRDIAADVAAIAARELPDLRTRYAGIAGGDAASIWLLGSRTDARRVLGRPAPAADATSPHAVAWVDSRGEVQVDVSRYVQLDGAAREAALRHVLAHLAIAEATTAAPPLLVEGIAAYETRDEMPPTELGPLADAFTNAKSGVATNLVAAPRTTLDGDTDAVAAEATVRWIVHRTDVAHLVRLVQRIDSGTAPDRALADVLHATPREVERGTAAWVRMQLAAVGTKERSSNPEKDTAR